MPHLSENRLDCLQAALGYAARGWPVFPMTVKKRPLTEHGLRDASVDPDILREWWKAWPYALAALSTGAVSGVVVVDVDVRPNIHGPNSLAALGVEVRPKTPTAHTPSGGYHMLFRHPGGFIKSVAGKLGPGLDIRGDGGSSILPPGPGRHWDTVFGPDMPLAEYPAWAVISNPPQIALRSRPPSIGLAASRLAEVAIDDAVRQICSAPEGTQYQTLNRECFGIGKLVGAGLLPEAFALEMLRWAAGQMPGYDPRRPWRPSELDRIVRHGISDGMAHPRRAV